MNEHLPEPLRSEPELLATLSSWDSFGERALMQNETRNATVRVASDELLVMCITREVFEEARIQALEEAFDESRSQPSSPVPEVEASRPSSRGSAELSDAQSGEISRLPPRRRTAKP